MSDFVRVRLANGSEASVSPEFAKRHQLEPLDKPASKFGVALPAKHNPIKKPAESPAVSTPPKEK